MKPINKQKEIEDELIQNGIMYKPFTYLKYTTKIEFRCVDCGEWKTGRIDKIIKQKQIFCKKCTYNHKKNRFFQKKQIEIESILISMGITFKPFIYNGDNTKIEHLCSVCNKWKKTNIYSLKCGHFFNCKLCSLSINGNKRTEQTILKIKNVLNENNITYKEFDVNNIKEGISCKCKGCDKWIVKNQYVLLNKHFLCFDCGKKVSSSKNITPQIEMDKILKDLEIIYKPFKNNGIKTNIEYKCKNCGKWKTSKYFTLIKSKCLCEKCSKIFITQEEADERLNKSKIIFKPFKYNGINTLLSIKCPSCNIYKPLKFIYVKNYKKCGSCNLKETNKKNIIEQDVIEKKLTENKIIFKNFKYNGRKHTFIEVMCSICGEYSLKHANVILNNFNDICQKCGHTTSIGENEVKNFIETLGIGINENKKQFRCGEIDIFIPELNIGFEYNGLWWHNEIHKPKNYHKERIDCYDINNIKIINIWEDDWLYKQDIVKSIIRNVLGVTENKIYARKCEIMLVPVKEKSKFLNENHIQGTVSSKINLGLYCNNELVSIMTFGYGRNQDFQLSRFCSKLNTNVIGGFSKLLVYFERNYGNQYSEIKTFADRSWSNGDLYEKNGFELVRQIKPDYQYVVNGKRVRKQQFTHKKLIKEGFDSNKTEHEIMLERKIYRIYDCGKLLFTKKIILI